MKHKKQTNISLARIVAVNNTAKAKRLIRHYGVEPARDMPDLINKLNYVIKEFKEESLEDIAKIHPHYDLIEKVVIGEYQSNTSGPKSSACGCGSTSSLSGVFVSPSPTAYSGELADTYIDANGESSKSTPAEPFPSTPPVSEPVITKTEVVKVVEKEVPATKNQQVEMLKSLTVIAGITLGALVLLNFSGGRAKG